MTSRTAAPQLLDGLREMLGDRLSTSPDVLAAHGRDESYHPAAPPDAVVFPDSVEEVSEIVKVCARHRAPIIPFGTGTSLEGHVAALNGGICIELMGLNSILDVRVDDLDATVQAGVTRKQLNDHLRDLGLFFPIDPGADASLGGMAATGASGTTTVRYGTMRENTLWLKVVLADGRIVETGSRARKSSAGYDLTRLFIGSEGTLGIICELTLRVYGRPEAVSAAVCSFSNIQGVVDCVIEVVQLGIPVARAELADEVTMDSLNRHSGLDYPVAPTLFLEFHGSEQGVEEQARAVGEVAARHDGGEFRWATRQEDRTRMWRARHDALYAALALRPGSKALITDVCVPISALAECISRTKEDLEASSLLAPIVGHVGDGNFHIAFVVDPDREEEIAEARKLNDRLVERALGLGGTCTGEHGIGSGKIDYLRAEHGEGVEVMRAIKLALDPLGLMNPGKVLD
jgi:D-lactate dehydrogenase (cytochrome)